MNNPYSKKIDDAMYAHAHNLTKTSERQIHKAWTWSLYAYQIFNHENVEWQNIEKQKGLFFEIKAQLCISFDNTKGNWGSKTSTPVLQTNQR